MKVPRKHAAARQVTEKEFGPSGPPGIVLHPLLIFSVVWLGVVLLYSLHLSKILRYTTGQAATTVAIIWLPFALALVLFASLHNYILRRFAVQTNRTRIAAAALRNRLRTMFIAWIVISALETVVSGGVPLQWALTGSTKHYVDYGIPSVHGLVNSLQVAISISYFALFLISGRLRDLRIPLFYVVWCAIIINRNMMLVTLLEFAIVYVRFRGLQIRTLLKLVAGAISFVLIFGIIGDVRQGDSGAIRELAQPTEDYPEWLPSGVLWAYIYISTPINNLVYNVQGTQPLYNPLFPSTVSTLFPSIVRNAIYGSELSDAESGQLVVSAFNVSTAYVGPYRDFGYFGMTLFSAMIAVICRSLWPRRDLKGILMLAVVTQCLVLTLFFDHFFYLPVITQLVWVWYFFLPPLRFPARRPIRAALNTTGGEVSS